MKQRNPGCLVRQLQRICAIFALVELPVDPTLSVLETLQSNIAHHLLFHTIFLCCLICWGLSEGKLELLEILLSVELLLQLSLELLVPDVCNIE